MTTAKAGERQAKDRISDGVVNGGGPGAIACQVEDGVNTSTTTATTAAGGAASTNDGTTSPEQDKEESSSTGSDEVKGSGSGGGYSADCSSSDTSSVGHGKSGGSGTGSGNEKEEQSIAQEGRTVPEKEMSSLHLGSSTSMGRAQHKPSGGTMMQEMDDDDDDDESDDFDDESGDGKPAALPSSLKAQMMNHAEGQSGRLEEQGASNIHAAAALGAFPSSSSSNPARRGASRSVESLTTSRKGSRKAHLPQWNGVRIQHPMDPRIDLSTVGFVNIPSFQQQNHPLGSGFASAASHLQQFAGSETGSSSEQPTVPTVDQYMKLMESVRPFFHAHGLSHDQSKQQQKQQQSNETQSSDRFSSEFASTGPSDSDQKQAVATREEKILHDGDTKTKADPPPCKGDDLQAAAPAPPKEGEDALKERGGSDSESSMAVLARVKRKHLRPPGNDGDGTHNSSSVTNGGSINASSNGGGSNASSSSSLEEKRVRMQDPPQHHQQLPPEGNGNNDDVAMNGEADSNESENAAQEADAAAADVPAVERQESTSSSSDDRNNPQVPNGEPLRFGVPAMISEYSSSARTGNCGARNNHAMSTSGSGSGGNTNSGTGSGSNLGGSSGSGNDQGGISSNGNGSSGSGNDLKGSSEENVDNSGENNSGENSGGNSDGSNAVKVSAGAKVAIEDPLPKALPNLAEGHHQHPHRDDVAHQHQQRFSIDQPEGHDAAREKKIQDKKRKRMNMRREYEEKMEEEMASSDSSQDREVVLRPGKPVTLDKVLSFTKTPRLVVKAGPPFLVVYTNAAYSRLSGIDSHNAVGKPISSLLSIPDQYDLSQFDDEKDLSPAGESPSKRFTVDPGKNGVESSSQGDRDGVAIAGQESHAAAAGRARAADATTGDANDIGLESLVANSGFGRLNMVSVRSKLHNMVGRNIKVLKSTYSTKGNQEEGSNGSSTTSNYDASHRVLACAMSISPVVSSPEAYHVVTDKDQDSHHHKSKRNEKDHDSHQNNWKRRKHHHHHNDNTQDASSHLPHHRAHMMKEISIHRKSQLVSHYVIQLEPYIGDAQKTGAMESSTSTALEAQRLGLSKTDLKRQKTEEAVLRSSAAAEDRHQLNNDEYDDDEDEMESERSEHREHVSAIG